METYTKQLQKVFWNLTEKDGEPIAYAKDIEIQHGDMLIFIPYIECLYYGNGLQADITYDKIRVSYKLDGTYRTITEISLWEIFEQDANGDFWHYFINTQIDWNMDQADELYEQHWNEVRA